MNTRRLLQLSGILIEDTIFHYVLVRGDEATVVPETDMDRVHGLEEEGWEVLWDSARSPEAGYEYAAKMRGAWPQDLEDDMKPVRMREPKVLFRSVSIPELLDIAHRGTITGRRNEFNDFDKRRHVFFADGMTEKVIYQGEEVERQAAVRVRPQFEMTWNAIKDAREKVQEQRARALQVAWPRIVKAAKVKSRVLPDFVDQDFADYSTKGHPEIDFYLRKFGPPNVQKADEEFRDEALKLRREMDETGKEFRAAIKAEAIALRDQRASSPVTSAVLETRPIKGGLHYSEAHGQSGMGDEDEYGFAPDQVQLSDIVRIHWVKRQSGHRHDSGLHPRR